MRLNAYGPSMTYRRNLGFAKMMYRSAREKGWDRRIGLAVALWNRYGSEWARRYLVYRGWAPGRTPATSR